jgi:phage terminase large subunit
MIDIQIGLSVMNETYTPYLDAMERTQIYYGGSSSGKSVFLAQRDLIDLMKGGRNFLVCRQVGRTLRGSVVQELSKVINEWGLSHLFSINKTDGTITCSNGYQIIFAGLDDVEKLKSLTPAKGVFTDIRIEEATETDKNTVKQLIKRQRGGDESTPKRLTLSFNPILKTHWIYKEYFEKIGWTETQKNYKDDQLSVLKTTYKDNRFLTTDDIKDLESETDPYFKAVYTDGNWGILGDVIFRNWIVADLNDPDDPYYLPEAQRTNRRNGLDFGFSSDPAAYGGSHYDSMRKRIYIYDELYETGLTNPQLAEVLSPRLNGDRLACDSAEPKSIQELNNLGINAYAVNKGKDSVLFGIQWLQQQTIIIDKKCINHQNEFSQYHWKQDAGGNALPIPVDKNNHLIDETRYAYEDDMQENWFTS